MSCGTTDEYRAKANDISTTGMRLESTFALGTGHLIRIMTDSFTGEQKFGSVVWTSRTGSGYEAGVNFEGEDAVRDFVWYEEFESG